MISDLFFCKHCHDTDPAWDYKNRCENCGRVCEYFKDNHSKD